MKTLLADLRAKQALYNEYWGRCSLLRAFFTDGTLAIILYRAQCASMRLRMTPLALLAQLLNKWFNGCLIGVRAEFGPGLVLIHPVGTIINSGVRGGRNVRLQSGVVIGVNRGRSPALGDDVFVGSGAKIFGAVTVGRGARIGANAVVVHDVAADDTVVGIPARSLHR
jgi:serine O-acetyltransferase